MHVRKAAGSHRHPELGPPASGAERRKFLRLVSQPIGGTSSWQLCEDNPPVRPLEGDQGTRDAGGGWGSQTTAPPRAPCEIQFLIPGLAHGHAKKRLNRKDGAKLDV